MTNKAKTLNCDLRPHVKTHKTLQGAYLQTNGTCRKITVSTLAEASYFANNGFDDILYAVPITSDKLHDAAVIANKIQTFHIMVDNIIQLNAILATPPPSSTKPWSIIVMVDCGYHRDGVDPEDINSLNIIQNINAASNATFAGIYTHGGHSYDCSNKQEIQKIAKDERDSVSFNSFFFYNVFAVNHTFQNYTQTVYTSN